MKQKEPARFAAPASTTFIFAQQSPVRVVTRNGEPWFVAADVCGALDLSNTSMAMRVLDEDEKGVSSTYTHGGAQEVTVVSESGLYTLVLRCRGATTPGTLSHRFRKWVTGEVLPAIRRNGVYVRPSVGLSEQQLIALRQEIHRLTSHWLLDRNTSVQSVNNRLRAAFGVSSIAEISDFDRAIALVRSLKPGVEDFCRRMGQLQREFVRGHLGGTAQWTPAVTRQRALIAA